MLRKKQNELLSDMHNLCMHEIILQDFAEYNSNTLIIKRHKLQKTIYRLVVLLSLTLINWKVKYY